MKLEAGPGMLLALNGDVVECISRKESKNPKTTAKLTVGKTYSIIDVSYYCRRNAHVFEIWGYVTVINDKGDERSYPLHRFKNEGGVLAEANGQRMVLCERCYDRRFYFEWQAAPPCEPCARRPVADVLRPILMLMQPAVLAPVTPKASPSDPRPLPPGSRKLSL